MYHILTNQNMNKIQTSMISFLQKMHINKEECTHNILKQIKAPNPTQLHQYNNTNRHNQS